jgi:hypothetical protein
VPAVAASKRPEMQLASRVRQNQALEERANRGNVGMGSLPYQRGAGRAIGFSTAGPGFLRVLRAQTGFDPAFEKF